MHCGTESSRSDRRDSAHRTRRQLLGTLPARLNAVSPPPVTRHPAWLRRLRIVEVEARLKSSLIVPVRVEADRIELVLLLAMLLFVAEIFAGAGELMQQHRRRDRFVGIELEMVEAIALQPDGLLAAIFRQIHQRVGVVRRQREAFDGRELQRELAVDALALGIRERITDVVGNAVELAIGRRIDDLRIDEIVSGVVRRVVVVEVQRRAGAVRGDRPSPTRWMCQSLTVEVELTAVALLIAGRESDAKGLVVVRVAEDARNSGVKSSPTRLVVSLSAFTPMFNTRPSLSSGRAVRTLIVAPMPPVAISARPVLYTSTALIASAARFAKLNERELPRDAAGGRVAVAEGVGRRHLAAIERHHVELRAEAARRDERAFAVAAVDRDAGDSLQRFARDWCPGICRCLRR